MGYLEDINAAYQNAANAAASWAGVNAQAQHDAHKVMQNLVAQRDAYIASQRRSTPPPTPSGPPPAAPPPPPPPGPVLPRFTAMPTPDKNIKEAPSDIIQFDDDSVEIALLQDLLFEDIGGVELANISRSDLIDGQSVIYEPIKNLSTVRQEFNPNNVVATAFSSNYFSRFGIDLDSRGIGEPYVDDNGDLVIEVNDVQDEEEIQVQILLNGTIDLVDEQ